MDTSYGQLWVCTETDEINYNRSISVTIESHYTSTSKPSIGSSGKYQITTSNPSFSAFSYLQYSDGERSFTFYQPANSIGNYVRTISNNTSNHHTRLTIEISADDYAMTGSMLYRFRIGG